MQFSIYRKMFFIRTENKKSIGYYLNNLKWFGVFFHKYKILKNKLKTH